VTVYNIFLGYTPNLFLTERVINDFENLILPISNNNSSVTTVNETLVSPEPALVATGKNSRSSYDHIYSFFRFSDIRY
jgi:hypothetical protein